MINTKRNKAQLRDLRSEVVKKHSKKLVSAKDLWERIRLLVDTEMSTRLKAQLDMFDYINDLPSVEKLQNEQFIWNIKFSLDDGN